MPTRCDEAYSRRTSEITPRLIRQRVEAQLELEEGSLDAKEYRDAVKVATAEAIVSCH